MMSKLTFYTRTENILIFYPSFFFVVDLSVYLFLGPSKLIALFHITHKLISKLQRKR